MIEISTIPQPLFIERTTTGQHLSLDFLLNNVSDLDWEIQQLDLSVFAAGGDTVLRRSLNTNGIRPGVEILGNRTIEKHSKLCVFNPFHTLPSGLNVSTLLFEFHFISGTDSHFNSQVKVNPDIYTPKTDLCLPMQGRMIVLDGHDYYSHHRRVDLTHPFLAQNMGFKTNSGRYAYDFCSVNTSGELYRDEGKTENDWFGLGKPVIAPGDGVVAGLENGMQDNILGQRDFDFELAADEPNTIMGNYVIIDHLNGEYSLLAHLSQGSINLLEGDVVKQGQVIGKLGFSGSTGPWVHLHYELRTGIDLLTSKGLPTYFRSFTRYGYDSKAQTLNDTGSLDTGEIIENQN
jgi:hypothetical protein